MRVAMYYNNRDVRLEELPLVRTRASGICGSDLMEWYRIKKAPLVLGHEITGEVVEVGEGTKDFEIGDRVFSSHHVPCGKCRYCLAGHESVCDLLRTTHFDPGGFAEYIRIPKINVELGTLRSASRASTRARQSLSWVAGFPACCTFNSRERAARRESSQPT